jgi:NADPH:quinone reductase-like Zn-dependent oxidoreductase
LRSLSPSGSGGTGTAGLQFARALGASSIVTAARGADAALLRALGATDVVDYTAASLLDHVANSSVDLWVNNFGYDPDAVAAKLKPGGVFVTITHDMPAAASLPAGAKAHSLIMNSSRTDDLRAMVALLSDGHFKPVVQEQYNVNDVLEALRTDMGGAVVGKLGITIDFPARSSR